MVPRGIGYIQYPIPLPYHIRPTQHAGARQAVQKVPLGSSKYRKRRRQSEGAARGSKVQRTGLGPAGGYISEVEVEEDEDDYDLVSSPCTDQMPNCRTRITLENCNPGLNVAIIGGLR